jgi:hypothetical protein
MRAVTPKPTLPRMQQFPSPQFLLVIARNHCTSLTITFWFGKSTENTSQHGDSSCAGVSASAASALEHPSTGIPPASLPGSPEALFATQCCLPPLRHRDTATGWLKGVLHRLLACQPADGGVDLLELRKQLVVRGAQWAAGSSPGPPPLPSPTGHSATQKHSRYS